MKSWLLNRNLWVNMLRCCYSIKSLSFSCNQLFHYICNACMKNMLMSIFVVQLYVQILLQLKSEVYIETSYVNLQTEMRNTWLLTMPEVATIMGINLYKFNGGVLQILLARYQTRLTCQYQLCFDVWKTFSRTKERNYFVASQKGQRPFVFKELETYHTP